LDVCSFIDDKTALQAAPLKSYAAWSNDSRSRMECSSGGLGFEIGRLALQKGNKVCGVRYNVESHRAEHFIAASEKGLEATKGSKYIPSYTYPGFSQFDRKERYLVTGTPCQIDSLRRYVRKMKLEDRFVLVDFYCHGVPSMNLWKKYISEIGHQTGTVESVSWRDKQFGWHDSYNMRINGAKGNYEKRLTHGDPFYRLFLSDQCLGSACYSPCRFKNDSSSADVRIGDFWGKTYSGNEAGVSACVAFTPKGVEILSELRESGGCSLKEEPYAVVSEGQMKRSLHKPWAYNCFMKLLRGKKNVKFINTLVKIYVFPMRVIKKMKRICKI
jgi:coenzyme F420-reducing hydrogenase beta subunit